MPSFPSSSPPSRPAAILLIVFGLAGGRRSTRSRPG